MEETYRIVKIIDSENIVINAGKDNYIKRGDKFEIFVKGEEIKDLDGKTSLGTLDTIKDIVTVVTVFPRICICQKIAKSSSHALTGLFNTSSTVSLNVDSSQISGGFAEDLTIKLGDLARLTD